MAATFSSVETYLTAAQAAINSGDYTAARKQVLLGNIELAKLPQSEADSGSSMQLRDSFSKILEMIDLVRKDSGRGTRRSQAEEQ